MKRFSNVTLPLRFRHRRKYDYWCGIVVQQQTTAIDKKRISEVLR